LRKTTLRALVWLTAATTLVAGLPFSFCPCAMGSSESRTTAPISNKVCCGCGGGCCRTESSVPARTAKSAPHSACCSTPKPFRQGSGSRCAQFGCTGCPQALAQAQSAAVAPGKRVLDRTVAAPALMVFQPLPISRAQKSLSRRSWQRGYWCTPPTDLSITLQHLLI
jgi:hypothetical protein